MKITVQIFIVITLLFLSCKPKNTSGYENSKIDSLTRELNDKNMQIDSLKEELFFIRKNKITSKENNNYWYSPEFEGKALIKKGINNPEEYISNSLLQNTELIPLKAVLGGNMTFGTTQLLGNKWIIAEYDDGHILGKSIYQYKLKDNGEIEFILLDSENDN